MATSKYRTDDVTFANSKNVPFQRWYPYIEGYSPNFVRTIIERDIPETSLIYEPFAGTGTTLFASDMMGVDTIYSEVNPLLRFLIKSKIQVLTQSEESRMALSTRLFEISKEIMNSLEPCRPSDKLDEAYRKTFSRSVYFPEKEYIVILKLRSFIDNIRNDDNLLADLLEIAVFSCLLPVSFLKKQGDIRFKKGKELLTEMYEMAVILPEKILQIAQDVAATAFSLNHCHELVCCNAKAIGQCKVERKISAVITSPPYLNGTNYFRNTKLELWFLGELSSSERLRAFRNEVLTSAICDVKKNSGIMLQQFDSPLLARTLEQLEKKAYDKRIPLMVKSYFIEMHSFFQDLTKHLDNDAQLFIDLGDSIFAGVHVPTDLILNEVMRTIGYRDVERIVLRRRRSRNNALLSQVLLKYRY